MLRARDFSVDRGGVLMRQGHLCGRNIERRSHLLRFPAALSWWIGLTPPPLEMTHVDIFCVVERLSTVRLCRHHLTVVNL